MLLPSLLSSLLILIVGILSSPPPCRAATSDVKIGVVDWMTDYGYSRYGDTTPPYQLATNLMSIAAFHFNDKNNVYAPSIPSLGECNRNLTVISMCDDGSIPTLSVLASESLMRRGAIALVGVESGVQAEAVSMYTNARGPSVPLVSYWSTAIVLSDKLLYPNFFRTSFSDAQLVTGLIPLMNTFNVTRIGLVYYEGDSGPSFRDAIDEAVRELPAGRLQSYSCIPYDVVSIDNAIRSIAQSGLNYVVLQVYTYDLHAIAASAAQYGLLDRTDMVWILAGSDRLPGASDFLSDPNLTSLMNGLFQLSVGLADPDNPNFARLINDLPTFNKYIGDLNQLLPPHGNGTTPFSCDEDDTDALQLPPGFFDDIESGGLESVWANSYDSTIAVGLAACAADPTGTVELTGADIAAALRGLTFTGVSGVVSFDNVTGDRSVNSQGYLLYNWVSPTNDSSSRRLVAKLDVDTLQWSNLDVSNLTFRGGAGETYVPKETTKPIEYRNEIPDGLRALGYFEVAFITLASLGSLVFFVRMRHHPDYRTSQGDITLVIVVGCLVASWSILPMTVDDEASSRGVLDPTPACMAVPVLYALGIQLALAGFIGKSYRIFFVFEKAKSLRRAKIRQAVVIQFIACVILVEMCVLVAWIVAAPPTWDRLVTISDVNGYPLQSYGVCGGGTLTVAFLIVVSVLHAVALCAAARVAYKIKSLPAKYSESTPIALAIWSIGQLYAVCVPAIVATYTIPLGRFVIMSSMSFLSCVCILLFAVVPRVVMIKYGVDIFGSTEVSLPSVAAVVTPASPARLQGDRVESARFTSLAGYGGGEKPSTTATAE